MKINEKWQQGINYAANSESTKMGKMIEKGHRRVTLLPVCKKIHTLRHVVSFRRSRPHCSTYDNKYRSNTGLGGKVGSSERTARTLGRGCDG
jgi:hypothetical protein